MKIKNLFLFGAMIFLASCSQQQQAREPISHTSGTYEDKVKMEIEVLQVMLCGGDNYLVEYIEL